MRRREEALQELADDLERLVRLAYPLASGEMKDLDYDSSRVGLSPSGLL